MLENVSINCHSSIKFEKDLVIYIDPFKIKDSINDANIIMCTHMHYDHFSEDDIKKVKNDNTKIVLTKDGIEFAKKLGFEEDNILLVEPEKDYEILNLSFKTVSAYNKNKAFHPRENKWVGYILNIDNIKYYIAGDTDINAENKKVKCDVAFLPIGGTYTMNATEAAILANEIEPKIVVPTHYGDIVGSKEDVLELKNILNPNITCIELIEL